MCFKERISDCRSQADGNGFVAALTPEYELRFYCSNFLKFPLNHIFDVHYLVGAWFSAFPSALGEMVGCLIQGLEFHSRLLLPKFGIAVFRTAALKCTDYYYYFIILFYFFLPSAFSHLQLLVLPFYSTFECFYFAYCIMLGGRRSPVLIQAPVSFTQKVARAGFKQLVLFSLSKEKSNWAQSMFRLHEKRGNEELKRRSCCYLHNSCHLGAKATLQNFPKQTIVSFHISIYISSWLEGRYKKLWIFASFSAFQWIHNTVKLSDKTRYCVTQYIARMW